MCSYVHRFRFQILRFCFYTTQASFLYWTFTHRVNRWICICECLCIYILCVDEPRVEHLVAEIFKVIDKCYFYTYIRQKEHNHLLRVQCLEKRKREAVRDAHLLMWLGCMWTLLFLVLFWVVFFASLLCHSMHFNVIMTS